MVIIGWMESMEEEMERILQKAEVSGPEEEDNMAAIEWTPDMGDHTACLFPSQNMVMVTIRGTESMEGVMGRILPKAEAEEGVLREEDSMADIK